MAFNHVTYFQQGGRVEVHKITDLTNTAVEIASEACTVLSIYWDNSVDTAINYLKAVDGTGVTVTDDKPDLVLAMSPSQAERISSHNWTKAFTSGLTIWATSVKTSGNTAAQSITQTAPASAIATVTIALIPNV